MNITAEQLVSLITAITTLLGVIGGIVVSIRNGQKTDDAHQSIKDLKSNIQTLTGVDKNVP